MQQSRLFEIVYYLTDKKFATAGELAERFEVSPRTIYRDIDALSAAGIPVYSKKGKNGGIFVMQDFVLHNALLSENERDQVLMGLESLSATGHENEALTKLRALFSQHKNWVSVDYAGWNEEDRHKFSDTKRAVLDSRVVCFDYFNSEGKMSRREAEPLQLLYKSRAWYLLAHCRKREQARTFRLSRMKNLVLKDERFERDLPRADTKTAPPQPMVHVRLKISAKYAYRVYDEFGDGDIRRDAVGDLIVDTHVPDDAWLMSFVLSLGRYIEVLLPKKLRRDIKKQLKKALQNYAEES
ncbi:MAG: helix-turn-helix transcriptional regulator [Christensenellaceae bacterium]|jgi:predicted DNA-binding transcriptional regulator YafY